MNEYTPTTHWVRNYYVEGRLQWHDGGEHTDDAQFDRWHQAELRKAKAEALRDAAKGLQINTWMDLFEGPLQQRIASSQSVVDWLRISADQIEEE